MTAERQVDYVLNDCFCAAGQAAGLEAILEYAAIVWWRDHYREKLCGALRLADNCWDVDRDRLLGVSGHLGYKAALLAGAQRRIDAASAEAAALDVEAGCRLRREHAVASPREAVSTDVPNVESGRS